MDEYYINQKTLINHQYQIYNPSDEQIFSFKTHPLARKIELLDQNQNSVLTIHETSLLRAHFFILFGDEQIEVKFPFFRFKRNFIFNFGNKYKMTLENNTLKIFRKDVLLLDCDCSEKPKLNIAMNSKYQEIALALFVIFKIYNDTLE